MKIRVDKKKVGRPFLYGLVGFLVVAILVAPAVYTTQKLGQALNNQSSEFSMAISSAILALIESQGQKQKTVSSATPTMLEDIAKATVKIEVRLKYDVAKVIYDEGRRPSLEDLASGKRWLAEGITVTPRWLRYLGSGFVIYSGENKTSGANWTTEPETLILTNHHIIEQMRYLYSWQFVLGKDTVGNTTFDIVEGWLLNSVEIFGFFGGDQSFAVPLMVLGGSPERPDSAVSSTLDLAVLKTRRAVGDLPVLNKWAAEDSIKFGQTMYIVGYPLGNPGPSVTKGVVSVLQQNFGGSAEGWNSDWVWNNLVQYDAAQSPGNSGSVLITEDGEIIGIVRGSDVQTIQVLGPEPENPLWYDPTTGRPLPPILPPWLRTHDKPTSKLQWTEVHIPWEGIHYGVMGEVIQKWLKHMGLGFVLGE